MSCEHVVIYFFPTALTIVDLRIELYFWMIDNKLLVIANTTICIIKLLFGDEHTITLSPYFITRKYR